MATMSGFQNNFVESECLKDFECPLCLYVTRDPSLTNCCGHHFCSACINRVLSEYNPVCPLCKAKAKSEEEEAFKTMLDKKQKRRVLDLKVYCDKKDAGCEWTGILGEIDEHIENKCLFVTSDCPNNCGATIQKRNLPEHEANDCPKRPHSCEYCQLKGTYQDIQENHLPVCPEYPVPCPYECSATLLKKDQLKQHLVECPLAMVECELREVGCQERLQRKDLDTHMEEAALKHLRLMTSYNIKTVAALKDEHLELKKELAVKNEEIVYLKQKLEKTSLSLERTSLSVDLLRLELKPTISQASQAAAYMKTTFVQIVLEDYSSRAIDEFWESFKVFYTFPSRHKLTIDVTFCSDRISIRLVHLLSDYDQSYTWPKKFMLTVRMLNQDKDSDHFVFTRELWLHYDSSNDDTFIKRSKIRSGGGKYLVDDSLRLEFHVSEV